MDAGSDLQAKLPECVAGRFRAADGTRRPVEGCEESVAGGVHLAAAEAVELAAHGRVVGAEEVAPPAVAELSGPLG